MTLYLNCGCSKAAGKPRTQRVKGCEEKGHKWSWSFRYKGSNPIERTAPYLNKDAAKDWMRDDSPIRTSNTGRKAEISH